MTGSGLRIQLWTRLAAFASTEVLPLPDRPYSTSGSVAGWDRYNSILFKTSSRPRNVYRCSDTHIVTVCTFKFDSQKKQLHNTCDKCSTCPESVLIVINNCLPLTQSWADYLHITANLPCSISQLLSTSAFKVFELLHLCGLHVACVSNLVLKNAKISEITAYADDKLHTTNTSKYHTPMTCIKNGQQSFSFVRPAWNSLPHHVNTTTFKRT